MLLRWETFQQLIAEQGLSTFKYGHVLLKMISKKRDGRLSGFQEAYDLTKSTPQDVDIFDDAELLKYRAFANIFSEIVTSLGAKATTKTDIDIIIQNLKSFHRSVMLEEYVLNLPDLISIFISGSYTYYKRETAMVETIKNFIDLIQTCSPDKNQIIMENISSRINSIPRVSKPKNDFDLDDEIPF